MCKILVSNSCSVSTMSRMVILGNFMRGCAPLFEGDDETPLLSASRRITY
jgi:hypothetical protein